MKYKIYSRLSLFSFLLIGLFFLMGCEKETIEIKEDYYIDELPGTAPDKGAVEFRVKIPWNWSGQDYIEVSLDSWDDYKRAYGPGNQSVRFSNLNPGDYHYLLTEWALASGIYTSTAGTYSTQGGWGSSSTTYYGGTSYDPLTISGTAKIKATKVLIIEIEIE